MSIIKAICFDLDGVYFTPQGKQSFHRALSEEFGANSEKVDEIMHRSDAMRDLVTGKIEPHEFWEYLRNMTDITTSAEELEAEVSKLMQDDDVTKKSGIYPYILTAQERHLSIRAFNDKMKREAYEKQKGICIKCGEHFALEEMEADHITPWHEGGKTIAGNCQMLCKQDNRTKSGK